jgi:tetratricopeptide (TPR) repeat protein
MIRDLALNLRAYLRRRSADWHGALDDMLAKRGLGDNGPQNRIGIAAAWRKLGQTEKAEAVLEDLLGDLEEGTIPISGELYRYCQEVGEGEWLARATAELLQTSKPSVDLYMLRSLCLSDRGDYEAALLAAEEAITLDPEDYLPYLTRGRVLIDGRRFREALADIVRAGELQPRDFEVEMFRGYCLHALQRWPEALECYEGLVHRRPFDPGAHTMLADCLWMVGRPEEAVEAAERAVELDPHGGSWRAKLAMLLVRQDDFERALQEFDRGMERHMPHETRLTRLWNAWRVEALWGVGRRDEALAACREVLAGDPTLPELEAVGRFLLLEAGEVLMAIDAYRKLCDLAPHRGEYWSRLGAGLGAAGNHRGAEECYRRALESELETDVERRLAANGWAKCLTELGEPQRAVDTVLELGEQVGEDPGLLLTLAQAYTALGKAKEAGDAARKVLEHDARATVLHQTGAVLLGLWMFEEAAEALRRSLSQQPRNLDALSGLGIAMERLGRSEEALEAFQSALELDPNHWSPLCGKMVQLFVLGRGEEALPFAEEALRRTEDDPFAVVTLAECLLWRGTRELRDPDRALELTRRLIERDERDYRAWQAFGIASYRLGRFREAMEALDRSSKLAGGVNPVQLLFGAMALWRSGREETALRLFTHIDEDLERDPARRNYYGHVRDEAAELLGVGK